MINNSSQLFCIFCAAQGFTRSDGEHVIPKAIGGSFTIFNVCHTCDSTIGNKCDAPLINQPAIRHYRVKFKLKGQTGSFPHELDPILNRTHSIKGNPLVKVRLRKNSEGAIESKLVPHIKLNCIRDDHGNTSYEFDKKSWQLDPEDIELLPALIRSAFKKERVTNEKIIQRAIEGLTQSQEKVSHDIRIECQIKERPYGHRAGIIKIAFEMAWYWLGNEWLKDSIAQHMRSAILTGSGEFEGMEAWSYDTKGATDFNAQSEHLHSVTMLLNNNSFVINIKIFSAIFEAIIVTRDAQKYQACHPLILLSNTIERKHTFYSQGLGAVTFDL